MSDDTDVNNDEPFVIKNYAMLPVNRFLQMSRDNDLFLKETQSRHSRTACLRYKRQQVVTIKNCRLEIEKP